MYIALQYCKENKWNIERGITATSDESDDLRDLLQSSVLLPFGCSESACSGQQKCERQYDSSHPAASSVHSMRLMHPLVRPWCCLSAACPFYCE